MGKGMDRYGRKLQRAIRRRNHVAKDLSDRKYHQRVKEGKKIIRNWPIIPEDYDD
jgi:hypothetical protein